ncbi:MAG: hypothetical protein IV100_05370 [Myxococcales bacterium]|nr:hypothetical protein [Myxococcales bacterium]
MSPLTMNQALSRPLGAVAVLLMGLLYTTEWARADEPAPVAAEKEPDFDFEAKGRLQVRYTHESEAESNQVELARARLILKGGYKKVFDLDLGMDFGGFDAEVTNAFLNVKAYKKHLQVRAGRMKRPFLRQFMTSSFDLVVVERSILASDFQARRDLGLLLHNGDKDEFEWALGVFGDLQPSDFAEETPEFRPAIAARVAYHQDGLDPYSEGDRKGGGFRVGGAVSALVHVDRTTEEGRDTGYRLEGDVLMRVAGTSIGAGVLFRAEDLVDADFTRIVAGFGNVDYTFLDDYTVAARYSLAKRLEKNEALDRTEHELTVGAVARFFGDHLSVYVDGSWLRDARPSAETDSFRFRLQLGVK